jgi:hypothetical protein
MRENIEIWIILLKIWLRINMRDYVRKYRDMNCFVEDLVEKIENHKIELK